MLQGGRTKAGLIRGEGGIGGKNGRNQMALHLKLRWPEHQQREHHTGSRQSANSVVGSKALKASSLLLAAVMVVYVFEAGYLRRGRFIGWRGRWMGGSDFRGPRRGAQQNLPVGARVLQRRGDRRTRRVGSAGRGVAMVYGDLGMELRRRGVV